MTLKVYLAHAHQHRAEEIAARAFFHDLRLLLPPEASASLVCNMRVFQLQLDAVLFTPEAVTVIDWKDTPGPITGSDRGPWLRDGEPVLAGTHENPFQQILAARRTLAGFLRKSAAQFLRPGRLLDTWAFEQVSAALVFIPARPDLRLSLPRSANAWLTLTGLDEAARDITTHRSRLQLEPDEVDGIIEKLWLVPRWTEIEALAPHRAAGRLQYVWPDRTHHTHEILRTFTVGRGAGSSWILPQPAGDTLDLVSRQHAQFQVAGGEVVVYDLNATNGTYCNGARLAPGQPRPLQHGDVIVLGAPAPGPGAAELVYRAFLAEAGDNRTTHQAAEPAP